MQPDLSRESKKRPIMSAVVSALHLTLLVAVASRLSDPGVLGQVPECTRTGGGRGQCRPLVKCVRFIHEVTELQKRPCSIGNGERGVCCPHVVIGTATFRRPDRRRNNVLRRPPPPPVRIPPIKTEDISVAAVAAQRRDEFRRQVEDRLRLQGLTVNRRNSPSAFKHRRLQRVATPTTRRQGSRSNRLVQASSELVQTFALSPAQGTHALPVFSLVGTSLEAQSGAADDVCNSVIDDDGRGRCTTTDELFRSFDGACNNRRNPHWGMSNVALQRLLDPKYEDGVSVPRGQISELRSTLPSPRAISEALIADLNRPSLDFTLMLMQWGQFVDHDITHTPLTKGENDEEIGCCSSSTGQALGGSLRHPECLPIEIPASDTFYRRFGQRCMEFVRSLTAFSTDCRLGAREQINQITAFIDASNVYGSDTSEARVLRLGRGGRLRVTKFRGDDLLPLDPNECADHDRQEFCFEAGDVRCNEQPQLTVMHTLWMREHNRVASQLQLMNSHWEDERLYQESRKILGAEMQHITYNEWLPIVLGNTYVEENNLSPLENGLANDYDQSTEPSITNAFATAAFRFGHSLVQGQMESYGAFGNLEKSLELHQQQLAPFELYKDNSLDGMVRGLATQPSQNMDTSVSKQLTQHLFQDANDTNSNVGNFGMDLMALNVQRGRDHGIPPYHEYRKLCGLPAIRNWRQLSNIVAAPELVPRLQRLFGDISDIDLFLGGLMERPADDALLGPTFQCLVGDQFKRLKFGDRFWFEEGGQPNSFTEAQVNAIRDSSLARVLCENGDNIQLMQPLVFKAPTNMNSKVGCSGGSIPRVNLEPWRE